MCPKVVRGGPSYYKYRHNGALDAFAPGPDGVAVVPASPLEGEAY